MKKSKNFFLEGKKVILRPYVKTDIQRWYEWFNDEKVTYYMDQRRFPNTYEKQSRYLKKMFNNSSDLQLAIVYKKDNQLIGTVGLHQIDYINGNADISVIIGERKYWKKGLGSEAVCLMVRHAFGSLNLNKLTAGMAEENKYSYLLFVAIGFKKEGLLREQIYLHGKYRNTIRLGLLRKEFKNRE